MAYHAPRHNKAAFNCPHCGAYAHQLWVPLFGDDHTEGFSRVERLFSCQCSACKNPSLWLHEQMIYPAHSTAPAAHDEMPEEVKVDFDEARSIVNASPRGAAALLRLGVQKLMKHLGGKGANINDDIKSLVADGLSSDIQQLLDYLRVVGNEAVHPGELNLNDTPEVALDLFDCLNHIVEEQIARPRRNRERYAKLPQRQRDAIDKRDK